jgi:hypothetical protein
MVFWVVMMCSSENVQSFRGTYCLHLQGEVKQETSRSREQGQLGFSTLKVEEMFASETVRLLQTVKCYNL